MVLTNIMEYRPLSLRINVISSDNYPLGLDALFYVPNSNKQLSVSNRKQPIYLLIRQTLVVSFEELELAFTTALFDF